MFGKQIICKIRLGREKNRSIRLFLESKKITRLLPHFPILVTYSLSILSSLFLFIH